MRSKTDKSLTLLMVLLASLCVGTQCYGDVGVAIHLDGSGTSMGSTITDSGLISSFVSANESFSGNGNQTAIVSSQVGPGFSSFVKQYARATSDRAGTFVPTGDAFASALYEDVVSLNGSGSLPNTIRLNLNATGIMASELNLFNAQARTSFSFRGTNDPADFAGEFNEAYFAERPYFDGGLYGPSTFLDLNSNSTDPSSGGWDSLTFGSNGEFNGTFSYLVNLDSDTQSYDFGLMFTTMATTKGGIAESNLGNSISLTSITDVDGNKLSGFSFAFESGRNFNSVPESTAFGLGWLILVGTAVRRKRG